MHIDIVTKEDVDVGLVRPSEELTAISTEEFRKQLALCMGKGVRYFVIDLSQLKFMDSTGIGTIISITKRVRDMHGDVRLAGMQPEVLKVFKLVKADRYFPEYHSIPEAMENLASTPPPASSGSKSHRFAGPKPKPSWK